MFNAFPTTALSDQRGTLRPALVAGAYETRIESFVTKARDKAAALTFVKKALKRHGSPEVITTDGLASYRAAMKELGNTDKQAIGRWANNRIENSHLPFQRRVRAMLRF